MSTDVSTLMGCTCVPRFAPYVASLPKWSQLAPLHPLHWSADVSVDHLFAGSPNGHMLATNALENGNKRAIALLACGEAQVSWGTNLRELCLVSERKVATLVCLGHALDSLASFAIPSMCKVFMTFESRFISPSSTCRCYGVWDI
eukprot:6402678-Amphidinium_carterae.1